MTGPEHYREAERLLELASVDTAESSCEIPPEQDVPAWLMAAAQVHATLALAAATATHAIDSDTVSTTAIRQWIRIAEPRPGGDR